MQKKNKNKNLHNRKAPNEHTKVMTKNQLKTEDNELMAAAIA